MVCFLFMVLLKADFALVDSAAAVLFVDGDGWRGGKHAVDNLRRDIWLVADISPTIKNAVSEL
jgi:hypothetical protein